MSKVKYDIKKVPRELLEQFVVGECNLDGNWLDGHSLHKIGAEIRKAAEVQLRTRAEVDADIVKAVRDYVDVYNSLGSDMNLMDFKFKGCFDHPSGETLPTVLKMLLAEETSD